jgi:hypothetical protein
LTALHIPLSRRPDSNRGPFITSERTSERRASTRGYARARSRWKLNGSSAHAVDARAHSCPRLRTRFVPAGADAGKHSRLDRTPRSHHWPVVDSASRRLKTQRPTDSVRALRMPVATLLASASSSSSSQRRVLMTVLASASRSRANCFKKRCCGRARSSVKRTRRSELADPVPPGLPSPSVERARRLIAARHRRLGPRHGLPPALDGRRSIWSDTSTAGYRKPQHSSSKSPLVRESRQH